MLNAGCWLQETVEELLTKQRGDSKLLREAEAKVARCSVCRVAAFCVTRPCKAARLELEVESLKAQLAQSKVEFRCRVLLCCLCSRDAAGFRRPRPAAAAGGAKEREEQQAARAGLPVLEVRVIWCWSFEVSPAVACRSLSRIWQRANARWLSNAKTSRFT